MDTLKGVIDKQYAKWAQPDNSTLPVKMWRVESQQFAIQLSIADDSAIGATQQQSQAERVGQAPAQGERSDTHQLMAQVIYMDFVGAGCR
jgi:hypothetical protein